MSDTHQLSPLQALSGSLAGLVAAAAPSVVAVRSHRSRASGFVWRPGLVVTADETLAEEGEIAVVLPDGKSLPASLVGRDPTTDVALLRVEGAAPEPLSLSTRSVGPGALALVVGSRGGAALAALGVVSVAGPAWRSLRGGEIDALIELDVSLRRDAEGGVALDASGDIIGMAVFGPRRKVLLIPSATIERVAAKLETHGRVPRGYLGLGLQPVRMDDGSAGAMVMSVDREGPSAAAGIHQGDVVVARDGRPIESVRAFLRALGPESVGSTMALSLRRAGKPVEVTLTVGERPQA